VDCENFDHGPSLGNSAAHTDTELAKKQEKATIN